MKTESVVLLHGFAGSPQAWDVVCRALPAEIPRECITLTGHESDDALPEGGGKNLRRQQARSQGMCTEGLELDQEAMRILERCKDLKLKGIHLVGYSLGARVALSMLLQNLGLGGVCDGIELTEVDGKMDHKPEQAQQSFAARMTHVHPVIAPMIARVTLIGVNPGLRSIEERAQRWRVDQGWASFAAAASLDAFLTRWEAQPVLALTGAVAVEQQRAQRVWRNRLSGSGLASALRAFSLARMQDTRPQWSKVSVPVTLVAGQKDARYAALSRELVSLLPNAPSLNSQCVLVSECGHNVVLEHPEVIVQLLLAHHNR